MDILVRRPTEIEVEVMKTKPIWECEVSEFDWYYDREEISLIIKGE